MPKASDSWFCGGGYGYARRVGNQHKCGTDPALSMLEFANAAMAATRRLVAARNVADFKATRRGGESKYQVATAIVVSDCMAP